MQIAMFLFAFLITIDQLSKYFIRHFGGFYICNKNIAFGLEIPPIIFWIFWLIIIALVLYAIRKPEYKMQNAKYCVLILSGAASNMLDRLYFGCVIDFIDLKFWPVFNLADSFITIGVIILVIKYLKK